MKKILFLFLFVFVGLFTLKSFSQKKNHYLSFKSDFDKISTDPLTGKYGMTKAIKVVYDLKKKEIFYINPNVYKYHYDFCYNVLGETLSLYDFNQNNYSNSKKRRFLLGNINYFEAIDAYALELSSTDLMYSKDIVFFLNYISKTSFIKDKLFFLLNNPRLKEDDEILKIKTLSPSTIYKNLKYQSISNYKNRGELHFIKNLEQELSTIKNTDIIVINETPLTLPQVAGVIITEFQTPLSHLTILGRNRKIPIAVIKNAFENPTLKALNKKRILLKVTNESYFVEPTNKSTNKGSRGRKIRLKHNLEVDTLIGVSYLTKKSYKYVGNKASNFGVLYKLSLKNKFKVPENAFAIPFFYYNQHIEDFKIKGVIDSLKMLKNNDSIKNHLKRIRTKIKASPVNTELIYAVNKKTLESKFKRFRFRSSTNAEDAKGFSGAGLYTSKTGVLNSFDKTYEKAIKKVWASLWSDKAYFEREYFHINHTEVFMGILVHRSFPNEEVNGVAITKNIYRSNSSGFVVNAQLGNENVVNPTDNVTTDQFICYPNTKKNIYENKISIDVITQSSLNNNKLTMTRSEIQNLANQLEVVKKYYSRKSIKKYSDFGLDIEFKLNNNARDLYIKQVRLFND